VVAAHNHVLRRWLRGDSPDALRELDDALRRIIGFFVEPPGKTDGNGATIVAFRTAQDVETLIPVLRRLAGELPTA
jgi:hypothetical protein